MKNKSLKGYIPYYPKGCSLELLAVKAGYVKTPCTEKDIGEGIKRLKRDLGWITVDKKSELVERQLPVQITTRKKMEDLGISNFSKKETIYLSRRKG